MFRNVLITGASHGIGKGLAVEYSKTSEKLFLIARTVELLNELKISLQNNHAQIFTYKCDVSNREEVEHVFSAIYKVCSNIDLAILNAGISKRMDIEKMDSSEFVNIFNVNVFGVVYFVEKLIPAMIENNSGRIVGISSLSDSRGFSKSGAYCSSKAALTIYLDGLRTELRRFGISVQTVKPGFVKTNMTDKNEFNMPLIMPVEKAVKIIVKGIRKNKAYIVFPKTIAFFSGLIGLLPARVYDIISEIGYKRLLKNK